MEYMNRALDNMRRKNKELEENITDLRWRSMKNNLIFNGLPENRQENVVEHLRYFLDRQLGITKSISFGNVHRFGRAMRGRPRPIVARFLFQDDRELVLSNARMLRGTDFGIREQYPREIEEKRKQLYPIEREFRRDGARTKMVRDKLYVNGRLYIPEDDEEWYDYNDWRDREKLMDTDTCTASKSGMSQNNQNNQGAYGQALIHTTPIVSSPVSQPVVASSSAISHTTHVVGSPGPHTSAAVVSTAMPCTPAVANTPVSRTSAAVSTTESRITEAVVSVPVSSAAPEPSATVSRAATAIGVSDVNAGQRTLRSASRPGDQDPRRDVPRQQRH
ncbi:hypothetical protein FSP39_016854 [Pinctada imbricata]|uniref:Uncharacterized protein n=1 Tax=Pinctada imbricata TaxID=66713 RepID=A0AA88YSG5_PINIB|nr:hypothetical protein FSP39_016854 [Pinctada imbricata]